MSTVIIEEGTHLARGRILKDGSVYLTYHLFGGSWDGYNDAQEVADDIEANGFGGCGPRVRWTDWNHFIIQSEFYYEGEGWE